MFGFVLVMEEEDYLGNYTLPIAVSGSEWFELFNSRSVYLALKLILYVVFLFCFPCKFPKSAPSNCFIQTFEDLS